MDNHWDGTRSFNHPYLPNDGRSVHILGREYNCMEDRDAIALHLRSLFWMTYRKGFAPIVMQKGPSSDAGWGCMHRCGQMLLAEAMTRVHLGTDWLWTPGCRNESYSLLRRMFQDQRSSLYSIQNITTLGLAVDKPIGSWFGPNTVAQIIKKLSVYDQVTNWYVHISVEDGIIIDEIKSRCRRISCSKRFPDAFSLPSTPPPEGVGSDWNLEAIKARFADDAELVDPLPQIHGPLTRDLDEDFLEIVLPPTFDLPSEEQRVESCSFSSNLSAIPAPLDEIPENFVTTSRDLVSTPSVDSPSWRPFLLFIPLRLGLHQPNPCYFGAIRAVLRLPQSVGILGGRPSHAVWIVGSVEHGDLICLDPHTTYSASEDELTPEDDLTHHCNNPILLALSQLDPSLVLGFVCTSEAEFDRLCLHFEHEVLGADVSQGHPLFELHRTRPSNLPPRPSTIIPRPNIESYCLESLSPTADLLVEADGDGTMTSLEEDDKGRLCGAVSTMRKLWLKCNPTASQSQAYPKF